MGGRVRCLLTWATLSAAVLSAFRGEDHPARAADAPAVQELYTLKAHKDDVKSVAFSPDGKLLASSSQDKTVRVWEAATGKEVRTLRGHTAAVQSVAFSPDGKSLASASLDETLKVWDAAT